MIIEFCPGPRWFVISDMTDVCIYYFLKSFELQNTHDFQGFGYGDLSLFWTFGKDSFLEMSENHTL